MSDENQIQALPKYERFFTDLEYRNKVDEAVLDVAYQEAVRRLEAQLESYRHIERTSSVLLGWIFAGFVSLAAAVVALYCSGGVTVPFIMAVYALAALVAPAAVLVRGIHFGQSQHIPGAEPKYSLNADYCQWLLDHDIEHQTKEFKFARLQSMQTSMDGNSVRNLKRIKCYRRAVRILGIEFLGAAALFLCLILF